MYKVYFTDAPALEGNSYDGSWKNLPDEPIIKLEYYTDWNKTIILEGYKEYNHCILKYNIGGKETHTAPIVLLIGRKETESDLIILHLKHKKIFLKKTLIGMEYNGQDIKGWRSGILNNPNVSVI